MELLQSGTARREEKKERGNEWGWFSQMKTTLKRCGVWRNHEKNMILENKNGIEKSKRDSREIRVFKRRCMRLS